MEGDSRTIIDSTSQWEAPIFNDSTIAMVKQWNYSHDSALYHGSGFWFQEVLQYFRHRDAFGFERHQAQLKPDKFMSETLLLTLLLLQVFLVAFLVKRGWKLILQFTKAERHISSTENDPIGGFNFFLWLLTLVVFSLMGHVLLNAAVGQQGFGIDSLILWRLFLYTISFFVAQELLYAFVGKIFFASKHTVRWIAGNKSVLFVYAMILTPVLIGAEIGVITNGPFIFWWALVFLLITRTWMLIKTIRIFSIGIGDFFYLILYLCALEIMPILLFYRGLFLL